MARVLYINHYAGSVRHGMEFRTFYMAREWQRLGHEVQIVAASFSHVRQVQPEVTAPLTRETIDGIPYIWLRTPAYQGNGLGRVRNMLAFLGGLYRYRAEISDALRPTVVIASSTYPLDIFPAHHLAKRHGAKLIFELHDLWPLSPMELGNMSRFHPFIMAMQQGEDFACTRADTIVSMLPKADGHLRTRGMAQEKFVVVPNGAVLEEWSEPSAPLPAEHAAAIARYQAAGKFVIVYAGAHGVPNNLGLALAAAQRLRDTPAQFCLVGQGPERDPLIRRVQELGLTNVDLLPSIPKRAIPTLLAAADVLFMSLAPEPLFRFGVSPNKLIDYMMASKPVITAMRAGNDPTTEHGFGLTVAPEDPEALAAAVRSLMAAPLADRVAMGARGRVAAQTLYGYSPLAKRFAACF